MTLDATHEVTHHEFIAVHRAHVVFAVSLGDVEQQRAGDVAA